MNTKVLFSSSALFMGIMGGILTFLPQELLAFLQVNASEVIVLFLQILGALYLGIAIQNWFVKGSKIGGIYNKPILMGNVIHFSVATLTLLKSKNILEYFSFELYFILVIIYSVFAISFLILTFFPQKTQNNKS